MTFRLRPVLGILSGLAFLASPAGAAPRPADLSPANPRFADGLRRWQQERPHGVAAGEVAALDSRVGGGRVCARVSAPVEGSAAGLTCDPIPVPRGGAAIRLRVDYRTEGDAGAFEVRVRPLDDKGQGLVPPRSYQYAFPRLSPSPEWTSYTRLFTLVPEAAAYDVTLWARGGGTLYVSGVEARVPAAAEYEVPSQAARLRGVGGKAVGVWHESALKKVYHDAVAPARETDAVALAAAGGECEAFQVVLVPKEDAASVRVLWEDLLGPVVLRREHGRAAWVDTVNVARPRAPLGRVGATPDPLPAADARDLKAEEVQPIWLTFSVPPGTPAGAYRGSVRIESDAADYFYSAGLPTLRIPVRLQVRPFSLPEEPSLETIARVGKCAPEWRDALRRNLREHRVSGEGFVGPLPVVVDASGGVPLDFAGFDGGARTYFGDLGLRFFHFPGVGFGSAAALADGSARWNGVSLSSPLFERAFPGYARRVARHLREEGWLKGAVVPLCEEPEDEAAREACRRLARVIREAAPEARIAVAGMPHPGLRDSVDIWVVPFPEGWAAPRLPAAEGKQVWAAEERLYSLDADTSSIDMRAYPWRLKRAGVSGVEWWSVSHWGPDPAGRPGSWETQVGGGSLFHPDPSGITGPVDTIRWEMYREGVEDYDALTLLERAHARTRAVLGAQDARFGGDALIEWATRPVAPSPFETTRDPRRLEAARALVDALIEFLNADPPCLVRFEGEGKRLVVEGAVRPGTEVRSGRSPVRVDAAGCFRVRAGTEVDLVVRRRGQEKRLRCSLADLYP